MKDDAGFIAELEDAATLDEGLSFWKFEELIETTELDSGSGPEWRDELDPIAALQDDEFAEIAEDDDVTTFADDNVAEDVEDDDIVAFSDDDVAEDVVEDESSVSGFVAFAGATKEELSSPQATKNIKELSGNILNKFILQISFSTRCTDELV